MPPSLTKSPGVAVAAMTAAFVLLYREVFVDLIQNWIRDPNYSHGFVIVPLAGYFVWQRRHRLQTIPLAPTKFGLAVMACGAVALLVGTAGVEFFLMRTSAIVMLTGIVLYLAGWRWLRVLAFPLAFLLLMIPIPAIVFYPITFKLQLAASQFGVAALRLAQVPVLREGNVILLPKATLEVAEACSGIRSLVALFTMALVYGYFSTPSRLGRCITALASIPIAIFANGLRVAATGLAVQYVGPQVTTGAIHTAWGTSVFVVSLGLLMVFVKCLGRVSHFTEARAA